MVKYRMFLGNLDPRVTDEVLLGLFQDHHVVPANFVVRRGYALVDYLDQATVDRAIDLLNGFNLMGTVMKAEPSQAPKRRRSSSVVIRNVPPHVSKEELDMLVGTFGIVKNCNLASSTLDSSIGIQYDSPDSAQQAVEQLNNYEYQGNVLKVDYMNNRGGNNGHRGGNQQMNGGERRPRQQNNNNPRGSGYPLRILVPSDFVGAIIGRKGQTIRNITTQSRARVDVHRDDNSGLIEKVISIYGQPENCTNACKEILKVMQQEASATNRGYVPDHGEVVLKMLADDRYCGRIIGKEGKVIKKIREDTDTKITVSNVQEVPAMYPDRVITIRGAIDSMASSEAAISTKLRECFEKEMQQPMNPNMMMQGNNMGMPVMPGMYGMRPPYGMMENNGYYNNGGGHRESPGGYNNGPMSPQFPPTHEMCQISVPNSAVGAIIGAGGSNIKQIIRDSNAFVTIEPKKDEDPNPAIERVVTIKGSQEPQWRASYFIFEKLKQEGFAGNDDVRLRTTILVPRSMVGRVIGKGGKNVREIQRMTGAMIKLPEDPASQQEETIVEIFGNFMATQSAMSRIRALVAQMQQQQGPGGPPPHNGNGHGPHNGNGMPPQRRPRGPPQQ